MTTYANAAALSAALSGRGEPSRRPRSRGSENRWSPPSRRSARAPPHRVDRGACRRGGPQGPPCGGASRRGALYVAISDLGAIVTDRAEDFVQAREEIAAPRDRRAVSRPGASLGELCG